MTEVESCSSMSQDRVQPRSGPSSTLVYLRNERATRAATQAPAKSVAISKAKLRRRDVAGGAAVVCNTFVAGLNAKGRSLTAMSAVAMVSINWVRLGLLPSSPSCFSSAGCCISRLRSLTIPARRTGPALSDWFAPLSAPDFTATSSEDGSGVASGQ
eukprot:CAMPEP_0171240228 /NCGR_PEP_ID=MMETSP0790-20130122/44388_1 /TAXON_ID=2925 /ORGANISM="Alexandrium catenella, Strain OF101" /LENGTH=156 /DNA_ID=CAMNT_0011706633 /DNA_START=113 /DNA_END=583 /DNA_ORIENTATION=+